MQNSFRDKASQSRRYFTQIASQQAEIKRAQKLRYQVFAEEMGARIDCTENGVDSDAVDEYCDHLLVHDVKTGAVVACTRLLSDVGARRLGYFYSEGEFHLDGVLALPGRFLEIGRTCVDPAHRGGVVLSTLWAGLAEYIGFHQFDYLMGCASIPPGPDGFAVESVYGQIQPHQFGPTHLNVRPRIEVPHHLRCIKDECAIPPLLQGYLRLGCAVLGDPFWDADFNVMDVFILLELGRIQARYEKRYIAGRSESNIRMASSST